MAKLFLFFPLLLAAFIWAPRSDAKSGIAVPVEKDLFHKVVGENEVTRILFSNQPRGTFSPLHTHPRDSVVVTLGGAKVVSHVPGHEPVVKQSKSGSVMLTKAVTHTVKNMGDTDHVEVVFEIKDPGPEWKPASLPKMLGNIAPEIDEARVRVTRNLLKIGAPALSYSYSVPSYRVALGSCQLSIEENGGTSNSPLKAGEFVAVHEGSSQTLRATGPVPCELVTIEFKRVEIKR